MAKTIVIIALVILITSAKRCPDGYGGKNCNTKWADPCKACANTQSWIICADYAIETTSEMGC